MTQQPDEIHFAIAKLAECKSVIIQHYCALEINRVKVDKYINTKKARAASFYDELQRGREIIVNAIQESRLALLELGDAQLASYAGTLAEQLTAFNLMTKSYATLIRILTDFADKLPDITTTNAAVIGRLMSNVRLGYYPTDLANVEHIMNGIAFPEGVTTNLFDPCCGEGKALKKLAVGNNCYTYGVELDEGRATIAQDELHRVGFGSFFNSRISREAFHLLFLNPPYLSVITKGNRRTRDEKRFLIDSISHLMTCGLLVYIIPYYRLTEDICRVLADNFTDISIHRFTANEFKRFHQIVVMGTKIQRINGAEFVPSLAEIALTPDSIPNITEVEHGRYALPAMPKKVETFKGAEFNELELARQLKASKSLDGMVVTVADESKVRHPPLPFTFAQLGLLGGSGYINGLIECDTPHIIKGRIIKEVRTEESENYSSSGRLISTEVTEKISNKMIFNILTPDGFKSLA